MIDFDTFTKIAKECGRFGENNCCQRLYKLAQSQINHPIWSHRLRGDEFENLNIEFRHAKALGLWREPWSSGYG